MPNKSPSKSLITTQQSQYGPSLRADDIRESIFENSERFYEQVLESMKEGVSLSDESGLIIYTNSAEDKMFGYRRGELIGQHVTVQNTYSPSENKKIVAEVINQLKQKGVWQGEFSNRTKNGRSFITSAKITALELNSKKYWLCVQEDITGDKQASEALLRAKAEAETERQRLRDLFMQAPAMIGIVRGPNHIYEFANAMYLKIVGKDQSIIGKSVQEVFPELKNQGVIHVLDKVYATGKSYIGKEVMIKLDVNNNGQTKDFYFDFVYHASKNSEGKIDGVLSHAVDVTDQVESRRKTEQSEKYFRSLIEHSADAISLTDARGIVTYASPSVKKLLGYKPEEMVGQHGAMFVHPDDLDMTRAKLGGIQQKRGRALTVEHRAIHRNGTIRWLETTATNLFEEPGVGAVVYNFRDVTERKLAEDALSDTRHQLEVALAAGTIATWVWDIASGRVVGDKNMAKFFGVKLSDVKKGLPTAAFIDAVHPEDRAFIKRYVRQVIKSGENYEAEYRLISGNGSLRWVIARGKVEYDLKGKPVRFPGVLMDITARKKVEEKLRESEERAQAVFKEAAVPMSVTAPDGKWIAFNRVYPRMFGYTAAQLKKLSFAQITHPDDRHEDEINVKRLLSGELTQYKREKRYIHSNGSVVHAIVRATVVRDGSGRPKYIIAVLQNITKRKQAEIMLRESEERFRQLADSMPQIVWTARSDGRSDYYNKQWYEYTGFKEGLNSQSWELILHPDDVSRCNSIWHHSVKTGEPYQIEYRFKDPNNPGKYRWFLGRALPVKDKQGNIVKWFGTCTDIDDVRRTLERKNQLEKITAALTAQRAQLVLLNKAKDEFISVASHQLRTPATGVKQYIGMTLEGYAGKLTKQQKAFLTQAYASNERQINIVNDLLRVAKIDAGKVHLDKKKTNLVSMVENIIHEQGAKFKERQQKVFFASSQQKLNAEVDADKIRMVIENIIDNASKYTPHNRTIRVNISKVKDNICISVQDEGVGVGKRDLLKIFNKFSRLDNPLSIKVGGTGLGLYWAKKITDLHGGTIEVDSALNKGSIFTIKVPM